jgi:peptidoglycan/LPS O-acetylase OafA/YrhL
LCFARPARIWWAHVIRGGICSLDTIHKAAGEAGGARVFHTLDALRGIAAIGIVVFHWGPAFAPIAAPGGYLAVDLFFMMSGVVLSHAYEHRFAAGMGALGFMRARLIRLYPLYLLGTSLGIIVAVASLLGHNSQNWNPAAIAASSVLALFILPNFSDGHAQMLFPLNIPSWSLFFEICVNLLFVIAWPLLKPARLVLLCLLAGSAVVLADLDRGNLDQGALVPSFAGGIARTVFSFFVGVCIARYAAGKPRKQSNAAVLAILVLVGIAIGARPTGGWRTAWDAACVLLLFPLIVLGGTIIDPGERVQKWATFLGITSYAIYVLHSPLSSILNSVTRHLTGAADKGIGAPYPGLAILSCLTVACWLIDRYLDMPMRRWLIRAIPQPK